MRKIQQGELEAAMDDLLACHRWARLVAQGGLGIDLLTGFYIEDFARVGSAALAHHGKLTARQLDVYAKKLADLAPFPSLLETIDVAERYLLLDWVQTWERNPSAFPRIERLSGRKGFGRTMGDMILRALFDWDVVLKEVDSCVDQLVMATRTPEAPERREAIRNLGHELATLIDRVRADDGMLLEAAIFRAARSRLFARLWAGAAIPPLGRMAVEEDSARMQETMLGVVLALARYRADRGRYPEALDDLVDAYLRRVPLDVFSSTNLRYRREGDGFVLWSVGPDGEDGMADAEEGWVSDDLTIRLPVPEPDPG
jgi:hypothetical protein